VVVPGTRRDDPDVADDDADPTIDRLKERREALADAADHLEREITRASGDEEAWRAAVRVAVDEVGAALAEHIRETEAPGGLYDDIATRTPRLIHAVDRLRREHETMTLKAGQVSAALEGGLVPVEDVREGCLALLTEVSRHRHRGADLLWEFYDVDIGSSD
jgi:hypothetical protein